MYDWVLEFCFTRITLIRSYGFPAFASDEKKQLKLFNSSYCLINTTSCNYRDVIVKDCLFLKICFHEMKNKCLIVDVRNKCSSSNRMNRVKINSLQDSRSVLFFFIIFFFFFSFGFNQHLIRRKEAINTGQYLQHAIAVLDIEEAQLLLALLDSWPLKLNHHWTNPLFAALYRGATFTHLPANRVVADNPCSLLLALSHQHWNSFNAQIYFNILSHTLILSTTGYSISLKVL